MAYTIPLPNLSPEDYAIPSARSLNLVADMLARVRASFDPVELQRRIAAAPSAEARMELQAHYAKTLRAIARAENFLMQHGFSSAGAAPSFFTEQENKAAQNVDQMLSPDYGVQLEPPPRKPVRSLPGSELQDFYRERPPSIASRLKAYMGAANEERIAPQLEILREMSPQELAEAYRNPEFDKDVVLSVLKEQGVPFESPIERGLSSVGGALGALGRAHKAVVQAPANLFNYLTERQLPPQIKGAPAALPPPGRKPEYEGSGQNGVSDVVPGGPGREVDIDALLGIQFTNAGNPPNLGLSNAQEGKRDEFITDLRKQVADKYEKARKGISDITLEKPTFEEGFGKIDPGMALALAGLSMFQPGKSAAEAISSGAKTGLMQLSEDRKIAAAQQREMREAQRQFVSDSLGQAKTLADIDLRSTDADLKVQELAQRHEEALRLGNYRNASLALEEMRAKVAANASPTALAAKMVKLESIINNPDYSATAREQATSMLKYLESVTRVGTTELGQSRLAATIIQKTDEGLRKDLNFLGLSTEDQKKYRAQKLIEAFKAAGLSVPGERTTLPPDYE